MSRSRAARRRRRGSAAPLFTGRSLHPQALAFSSAIGLSAFLLFSLELRSGRLVLPIFGGAPAVWTTSLCFFTAVLFLGYLYAHFAANRLPFRVAAGAQLALAIAAVVIVVVAPRHLADLKVDGLSSALNVLLVLGVVAGVPAFLLSTSTPLLSAWYAEREENPWWLFAVSNGASFAGLLVYPFLIAPYIGLSDQRILLIAGLVAYAASLAVIVYSLRQHAPTAAAATAPSEPDPPLSARRQAVWLFAALVPAGLLSATTNFLQTDLISAPLIWIGPLAVYLASFVMAFAGRGRPMVRACLWLVPAATTLLWIPYIKPAGWPPAAILSVELGALFVFAVAIHGRLAADRPGIGQLTRFYLTLTAGGALGTALVSLVAPLIFNDIYEYPLLIVLGLVALVLIPGDEGPPLPRVSPYRVRLARVALTQSFLRLGVFAVIAGVLALVIDAKSTALASDIVTLLFFGGIVVFLAFNARVLAVIAPVTLVILIVASWTSPLVRERTFFSVIEVRQEDGYRVEYSGTTLHGFQFEDAKGDEPSSYYSPAGPLGSVFKDIRNRTHGASIGVVGLGIGTTAAYAQPGDELTFFEIDPATVDIARNTKYFRYLANCPVVPNIVLGDARLSLEDQATGSFDILILDAFSSDTVPAHLLTKEAMETYMRVLKPGGVLAFHLSNRYYDLVPPVAATARSLGLVSYYADSLVSVQDIAKYGATESTWLVAGRSGNVGAYPGLGFFQSPEGGYELTDDFSDLTRSLDWGF
jgi:SAM-dependent methyltransferase